MTAPARVTQQDISRAIKAAKAAGFERAQIEIDLVRHRITIIIGQDTYDCNKSNPWDEE